MLLGLLAVGGKCFREGEACWGGGVGVWGVVNFCWGVVKGGGLSGCPTEKGEGGREVWEEGEEEEEGKRMALTYWQVDYVFPRSELRVVGG